MTFPRALARYMRGVINNVTLHLAVKTWRGRDSCSS